MREEISGKCIIHELARVLMTGGDKSPSVSERQSDSSLSRQSSQPASCFREQGISSQHSSLLGWERGTSAPVGAEPAFCSGHETRGEGWRWGRGPSSRRGNPDES